MSKTLNADGTLSIEEYSLVELLPQVIQAHKDGFEFNFDLNDGIPQQYAALTILKMYPVEQKNTEVVQPVGVQVETAPNSGVFENHEVPVPVKVDGRRKKV